MYIANQLLSHLMWKETTVKTTLIVEEIQKTKMKEMVLYNKIWFFPLWRIEA
jgi:hypothetical protein